jgi:hypothetical protein
MDASSGRNESDGPLFANALFSTTTLPELGAAVAATEAIDDADACGVTRADAVADDAVAVTAVAVAEAASGGADNGKVAAEDAAEEATDTAAGAATLVCLSRGDAATGATGAATATAGGAEFTAGFSSSASICRCRSALRSLLR